MEKQGLFLDEVLEARRGERLGNVSLATPISHGMWTLAALLIGALIVGWLFVGHYTRRERVAGNLVPQAGLIDVTAGTAGTVTRVAVQEGEKVRKGEALITLSSGTISAEMGDTAAAVIAQLDLQRARLRSDIADTTESAQHQAQNLRVQQDNLQSQLRQLDAQLAIERQQVRSLQTLLHNIQPLLAKGYVSALQFQQQQMAALDAQAQVKSLTRQRFQTEQQLAASNEQLKQLPLDTQTKLNDSSRQLAQVQESLDQNEAQRASVLRAPQAGTVSSVLITNGQAVAAGQPVIAIIPVGTLLQAQLLVPSSAIGFVHVGEHVSLRYEAFPYQKFGLHHGRVVGVSRNALSPAEILVLVGRAPPQPLYRVRVALDKQFISTYREQHALKPGMGLNADILLDRRRLIEWAFEPLFGMNKRFEAGS